MIFRCYTTFGDYMSKYFKIILAVIGGIITVDGLALFFVSNINLGNFLTVLLGSAIIFVTLKFKKLAKWFRILLVFCISFSIVCSSFLIIYGESDSTDYKEDAIIVLGAAVHGKKPSLTLTKRLDKDVEYHKRNPNAIIVVSGGQGAQEDCTEAEGMRDYLVDNGVNHDIIIEESNATSTYENFKFSKEILDELFSREYTVCFITNEYHILRAGFCASEAGIIDISHLHSNTNLSYLISGSLRECLAVVKYAVFKS